MESSQNQKMIMSTKPGKEKCLTKYDFPTAMVNCVPGTFLYLNKEVCTVDAKEKILTSSYDVVYQIKPKYFVGSSCSVWSSHLFDNRHNQLRLHQVSWTDDYFPLHIQKFLIMLVCSAFLHVSN